MGRRPATRFGRGTVLVLALVLGSAAIVEARGGGGYGAGGGAPRGRQNGRATRKSNSQEQILVQNAFRRDNLRRARHVDW